MKRLFRFLVVLAIALGISTPAGAQQRDIRINGANYYVTLATATPWAFLNANYVFTPQSPNVGACLFLENSDPTQAHTVTIAAFITGNPSNTSYQAQQGLWNAAQIVSNFTTVPAGTMKSLYINMTSAANVAIVVTGAIAAGGSPDTANMFLVQTTSQQCGSAMVGLAVQGTNPAGSAALLINPVLIAGVNAGNTTFLQLDGSGHVILAAPSTPNAFGFTGGASMLQSGGTPFSPWMLPIMTATKNIVYDGTTSSSSWVDGVDQWHTAIATAAGNTSLWPAVTAEGFHLVCVSVDVTANASLASAGIEKIQLEEASSPVGLEWDVFIPSTAATSGPSLYHAEACGGAPGLTAVNLNDALNVNLSTALATGEVIVRAGGMQF